jgi:hypothetical protein
MTLESTLRTRIADLPSASGRHTLTVQEQAWTVALALDSHDRLGCLLWDLTVRRAAPLPGTQKVWATRIAGRVTSLLEPLKLLEVDPARQQALLRSTTPTARDTAVQYFEVLLQGTAEATLRRYQGYHQPQPREQVAFALTYESLAKLLADLTAEK